MSFDRNYDKAEPSRTEVDAWAGPTVLGTANLMMAIALASLPNARKRRGSFGVAKLDRYLCVAPAGR